MCSKKTHLHRQNTLKNAQTQNGRDGDIVTDVMHGRDSWHILSKFARDAWQTRNGRDLRTWLKTQENCNIIEKQHRINAQKEQLWLRVDWVVYWNFTAIKCNTFTNLTQLKLNKNWRSYTN